MNQVSKYRQDVRELEAIMRTMPQVEMELEHFFADGTYTRVLHIPADSVIVGKVHSKSSINILAKGKIAIKTDEDEYLLESPAYFVSGAHVRKTLYALSDCVLINVHPWDGPHDVDMVEAEVIEPDTTELEEISWYG